MRILFTILLSFVFCFGHAQNYPINQNLGRTTSTLVSTNAIRADQGFINTLYADTTAANAIPYLKNYPGTQIVTYTGGIKFWIRNETATAWNQPAGGSGSTPNLQQVTDVDSVTTNGILAARYRLGTAGNNYFGTTDTTHELLFRLNDTLRAGGMNYLWQYGNGAIPGFETNPIGYVHLGMGAGEAAAAQATPSQGIYIGGWAGRYNTGTAAILIGQLAGASGTAIHRSVIIGNGAGKYMFGAEQLTLVGQFAGEVQGEASIANSGFGTSVLRGNRDGSRQTGTGAFALLRDNTWVQNITITAGGSGYTSATVTISAPADATTGTVSVQATATATVNAGAVTAITLTNKGLGYTTQKALTVTISGDGTGATATAELWSAHDNTTNGWYSLAEGWGNVYASALGSRAGTGSISGESSIIDSMVLFLGYNSSRHQLATTAGIYNAVALGPNSKVLTSNTIVLGDSVNTRTVIGNTFAPLPPGVGTPYKLSVFTAAGVVAQFSTSSAQSRQLDIQSTNSGTNQSAGIRMYNDAGSFTQILYGSAANTLIPSTFLISTPSGGGDVRLSSVSGSIELATISTTVGSAKLRIVNAGRVGIGSNPTPDASALLDLQSTTLGFLTPRMTQAQRDAIGTPATGLLIYQTDGTAGFYYYNSSAWTAIGGGSTPTLQQVITAGSTLTGTNAINWGNSNMTFYESNDTWVMSSQDAAGTEILFQAYQAGDAARIQTTSPASKTSAMYIYSDSISFFPNEGKVNIDSLRYQSDTTGFYVMGWGYSAGEKRGRVVAMPTNLFGGGGGTTWNGITDPTGDLAITFAAGESTTMTDQNTTEDFWTVNNATQTTGSMFSYNRTSTALAAGNNIMELVSSGANGTSSITATGISSTVTNTGTSSTNIAIYGAASGASNNFSGYFANGRVVVPATGGASSPSIVMVGALTTGLEFIGTTDGIGVTINGTREWAFLPNVIRTDNVGMIAWNSVTTGPYGGGSVIGIGYESSTSLKIFQGEAGSGYRDLKLRKLFVNETGSNDASGTGTFSSGTVTINTTSVTANSRIYIQYTSCSNCGTTYIGTVTAATSFVVNSSNGADASTFNWLIIN